MSYFARLYESLRNSMMPSRPVRERMLVEAIEPRILHSADISPLQLADHASGIVAEMRYLDGEGEFIRDTSSAQQEAHREVIFVDTSTPDYQKLIDHIVSESDNRDQYEIILIDAESDGLDKITSALASRNDLSAVHIISHGSDGNIELGLTNLTNKSLAQRAGEIADWANAFSDDGDILIYGCNLAATDVGKELVEELALITGTDVAASDDLTGHVSLGGDWELEYRAGSIEAAVAIDNQAQGNWFHVLGPAVADATVSIDENTPDTTLVATVSATGATEGNYAQMYWSDKLDGAIYKANTDGTGGTTTVLTGVNAPVGLAIDNNGGKMYWTTNQAASASKIQSANLDGSGVTDLVTGLLDPDNIALDLTNNKLYWTDDGDGQIRRANLDGSGVELLVSGLSGVQGIALDVDAGKMYWTDYDTNKIQRASLDGTGVEDLVTGLTDPDDVELDLINNKMYWIDYGAATIQRANLDGSGIENLVSTGLSAPYYLTLDVPAGKMYWSDDGSDKIQRANLDGSGAEDLVTTGTGDPRDLALSAPAIQSGPLSYSITAGNIGNAFAADSSTGKITVADSNALDFETTPTFNLIVEVQDTVTLLTDTATITINLNDVNDVPTVNLANFITTLPEDANTTSRIKVADIVVTDDAMGTNVLSLVGADAALFEIDGTELFLKAGASLDFETRPLLDVTVEVNDPGFPATPADSGAAWWDADWLNRRQITFDNGASAGNLVNFPVLVRLTANDVDFDKIKAGGEDIRFVDDAGTVLSYEIESWDDVGKTAAVWVRVPQIDAGSTTDFVHIYYNNVAAIDAQNAALVWDGGLGVWHLGEDPGPGGAGDIKDSDASPNDGTAGASMTASDLVTGQIGNAVSFDGVDDFIDFSAVDVGNTFTIQAWVKPDSSGITIQTIVANSSQGVNTDGFRFFVNQSGTTNGQILFETGNGSASDTARSAVGVINFDEWNHVAVQVDRASGLATIFHNGVDVTIDSTIRNDFNTSSDWEIGRMEGTLEFTGELDEVRIATVVRSADWIKASYLSQNSAFTFSRFGGEGIAIAVTDANDAPTVNATATDTGAEDTDQVYTHAQILALIGAGDVDDTNANLSVSISNVVNGTLAMSGGSGGAGTTFTFTPTANFVGDMTFDYQVSDDEVPTPANSAVGTATVTLSAVNDAPVANDDSYTVWENETLVVNSLSDNATSADLEAAWQMDEGAGTSITDGTGNGNDGTLNGATWTTSSRTGNAALTFDGVDDYVQTTNTTLDLSTATGFTLSAWFQTDTTAGAHHLLWQGVSTQNGWGDPGDNTPTSSEMHLTVGRYDANDKITFFLGYDVNDPNSIDISSASNFTDTSGWHHAVVVVSDLGGGTLQADLYVDGVLEGSDTGNQTDRSQWDSDLRIGQPGTAERFFDGAIDEVGIYDRALTANEVSALHATGILANDTDAESDPLAVNTTPVSTVSNGTLTLNADGSFTYTPNAGFTGVDTFTYEVTDGALTSNTATVTINVVNNPPVAADDPGDFDSIVSSHSPLSYWRFGEASGGTAADAGGTGNDATFNGVTLGQTGVVNGDPDTAIHFDGTDDYVEIAHDDAYLIDEGTIQLWFNADSLATDQGLFSKDSAGLDTGGHFTIRLLTNGRVEVRLQSTSGDDFLYSGIGSVTAGSWHHVAVTFGSAGMELFLDGSSVDTNAYTGGLGTTSGGVGNYEPIAIGASTRSSDDGLVTPLNDYFSGSIDEVAIIGQALTPAQIRNLFSSALQNYTLMEESSLVVPASEGVLINDADPESDPLTATLVSGPSNAASFTFNPDGSFTYTPLANFSGTDTFTYVANDGTSDSNLATVTITVTNINDAPTISSNGGGATAAINVAENTTAVTTVTASDADGDTPTFSITGGADAAKFSIDANSGALTFDSAPDFENPSDSNSDNVYVVEVTANDGNGGTDVQTITVNLTNVNEAPTAVADSYSVGEDSTLSSDSAWFDSNWQYSRTLSFDNLMRTENLVDFPVLVKLDSSVIDYAKTHDQGWDLRFFDQDGTPLAHEIEHWDEVGTSYVWVKIPQIDANSNVDSIVMYYGNAGVVGSGEDPTGVWSDYRAAYHLNEDPGPAGTVSDSAGNFDGINSSSTNTAGIIGDAQDFNGVDQHIDLGDDRSWINNSSTATLSIWVNPDTTTGGGDLIGLTRNDPADTGSSRITLIRNGDDIQLIARTMDDSSDSVSVSTSSNPLSAGTWHHVTGTVDYASDVDNIKVYVDGQLEGTFSHNFTLNAIPNTDSSHATIGSDEDGVSAFFDGQLDEARISDQLRSADWISAQYASMTGNLVTVGFEQSVKGVLANDIDVDGDALTVIELNGVAAAIGTPTTLASGAIVTLNGDGSFNYDTNGAFESLGTGDSTTDSFTYTLSDGNGEIDTVVVSITINGVNDAPTTSAVTLTAIGEDSGARTITQAELLANATDVDGPALTATGLTISTGSGTLVDNGNGTWDYTPAANDDSSVSFGYIITDGTDSVAGSATLDITPVNDAPTVNATASDTGTEDTDQVYTHAQMLALIGAGDVDDANANLSVTITNVLNGTLAMSGGSGGAGTTFTFTPTANFVGDMSFDYQVSDDEAPTPASSAVGTATVTLSAVNDAPTVNATASDTGTEDTDQVYTHAQMLALIGAGDVDDANANLSVTITNVLNGTLAMSGGSGGAGTTFTFTPTANFVGDMSFDYQVSDDEAPTPASSAVGTATVTLSAVNDAPTVNATASDTGTEDTDQVYTHAQMLALIGAGDVDDANANLSVTITNVLNGTLAMSGGSGGAGTTFTFTPTANFVGDMSFDYQVSDDEAPTPASSAVGTATVTLSAVNDAPTTSPVTMTAIAEDSGARIITQAELLANAADIDGPALTATSLAINAGSGSLNDNGDGTWDYTPAANDDTSVDFTYNITDGMDTVVGSASLDITPVDDVLPTTVDVEFVIPPVADPFDFAELAPNATGTEEDGGVLSISNSATSTGALEGSVAPTSSGRPFEFTSIAYEPQRDMQRNAEAPVGATRTKNDLTVIVDESDDSERTVYEWLISRMLLADDGETSDEEGSFTGFSSGLAFFGDGLADQFTDFDEKGQVISLTDGVQFASIALTAGAVSWAIRAGGLLTSLLAGMPVWRDFDPLPVVSGDEDDKKTDGEPDEKISEEEAVAAHLLGGGKGAQGARQ